MRTSEFSPRKPVFIVKDNENGKWKEQSVSGGAVVDMPQGRACVNSADPSAVIELAEDEFFLAEFRDGNVVRYVKISGGGGVATPETIGTKKGQVHSMVSNNQDGWDFPITVI
jgi:hypothetical protein